MCSRVQEDKMSAVMNNKYDGICYDMRVRSYITESPQVNPRGLLTCFQ